MLQVKMYSASFTTPPKRLQPHGSCRCGLYLECPACSVSWLRELINNTLQLPLNSHSIASGNRLPLSVPNSHNRGPSGIILLLGGRNEKLTLISINTQSFPRSHSRLVNRFGARGLDPEPSAMAANTPVSPSLRLPIILHAAAFLPFLIGPTVSMQMLR